MPFTLPATVDNFIAQTTQALMRTSGLGIYFTQDTSSDTLRQTGGNAIILRTTGATDITLPESGTVVTTASTSTLTNKTLTAPVINAYTLTGTGTIGAGCTLTSPAISAPTITGAATCVTLNGLTITSSTGTLTITNAKTVSFANSMAFAGTDGRTYTFPTTSATIARTDAAQTFTGVQTMTSPVFITPVLGTPASGALTNCTGLPLTTGVTGTLPAANGGTGLATYTAGDLIYASAATTLAKLASVATGRVLASAGAGVAPGWVTTIEMIGGVTSISPTEGVGYADGAGGVVTQGTSLTTAVTLDKATGQITLYTGGSIAAEASSDFVVNNSMVRSTDIPVIAIQSGSNGGNTTASIKAVAAGSFTVKIANNNASGGTAETGTIVLNFAVIRGASE